MDPITVLALANAAVALAQKAIPVIRDAFASGDIPDEEAAEWRKKYEALRALGGEAYSGPDYELSGR
jgi:hypothetical protein